MHKACPTLETSRLRLRCHSLEDFAASAAMWANPTVTQYIGGKPSTKSQAWGRLMNYVGHWSLLGFGYWLIEEKETGNFVGELGFADFKRGVEASIEGVPEAGWVLCPSAHGKGYATEALQAAHAWGDAHLPSLRTVCLIDPENAASLRVAEKYGYREIQRTTYLDSPTIIFERLKPGLLVNPE